MKTSNKILLAGMILILAAVTVFLITFRVHLQEEVIIGSGNVVVSERSLEPFTGIQVNGNFTVELQHSDHHGLSISTDDNIIDLIVAEVNNGLLHIYTNERFGKVAKPEVIVSFSGLETIVSQGGSSIHSNYYFDNQDISIEIMGGGKVSLLCHVNELNLKAHAGSEATLKGTANKLVAETLAGSELTADELICEIVYLDTHAGSTNRIYASEEIHVRATTGSAVDYYGNPGLKEINTNTGARVNDK
jgi:hypothetical protein